MPKKIKNKTFIEKKLYGLMSDTLSGYFGGLYRVFQAISNNLCPGRQVFFDIFLLYCLPDTGAIASVFS